MGFYVTVSLCFQCLFEVRVETGQGTRHGSVYCRLWQHSSQFSLNVACQKTVAGIVLQRDAEPAARVVESTDTVRSHLSIV